MIASVSNNDGDVNENGKKAKGLLSKSQPLGGDVLCLKVVIRFCYTAINLAHATKRTLLKCFQFQRTPLQKAERQNHHSIVQLLLKNDARPSPHQPVRYQILSFFPKSILPNVVFQMEFYLICLTLPIHHRTSRFYLLDTLYLLLFMELLTREPQNRRPKPVFHQKTLRRFLQKKIACEQALRSTLAAGR